jgi:hypothetical protein
MDEPIRTVNGDVTVAYHYFNIEDDDPANVDDPPSSSWFPTEYLTARLGIVYIVTPGHTHTPALTMQEWDREPPVEGNGRWELWADATFACPSGRIAVRHAMGEKTAISLELGAPGMMYVIRAYSRGRDRVREIEEDPDSDFDSVDIDPLWHAEEYLLQFWPTCPIPATAPKPFRIPN